MHQNLDVELSITEDLFNPEQNNIIWDAVGFIGEKENWENMKISRKF
jgi:hypothetical protein